MFFLVLTFMVVKLGSQIKFSNAFDTRNICKYKLPQTTVFLPTAKLGKELRRKMREDMKS